MQGERKEPRENHGKAMGESPLPACFGHSSPARSTCSVFPLSLLPTLKNSLGFSFFLEQDSRTWKRPRQGREEPEESMESPPVLQGHLRAGCAGQSNPPSLLLPNPKASPVLNTFIWRTNLSCDSDITFSVTKTLLSCFFSLKFPFTHSLLFGNTKVELETPTSANRTIPLPPPFK